MPERILNRSLIGHEDFDLGEGRVIQVRGEHTISLHRIELAFIFRTADEIKELDYIKYPHIGFHIIGPVIEYYFDPASLDVPDDDLVIKPNSIFITEPGRYIKVTVGIGGGGGGGMKYTYVGADYTVLFPNEVLLVDSAITPVPEITMPQGPVLDNYVGIWDCGNNAGDNNIPIDSNGSTLIGVVQDSIIDTNRGRLDWIFDGTTWQVAPLAGCPSGLGDFDTIIAAAEFAPGQTITIGGPIMTCRAPYAMDLTNGHVRISLTNATVGADFIVDVHMNGVTLFSTLLSIDDGAKTSVGATIPAILSTVAIPDNAEFTGHVTQVGSSSSGTGLKFEITGMKA